MELDKNLTKADTSLALKNSIKVCKIFFQWFQVIYNQYNSDLSLSSVVIDSFRNSFVDSIKKKPHVDLEVRTCNTQKSEFY